MCAATIIVEVGFVNASVYIEFLTDSRVQQQVVSITPTYTSDVIQYICTSADKAVTVR